MKSKLQKTITLTNEEVKVKAPLYSEFSSVSKILYGFMALTAMCIYVLQRFEIPLPQMINNYLNDLLCMPLILGAVTFITRYLKKDKTYQLSLFFVLFMAGYYSFYFEYYLPTVNLRYTADWIDVVLYFMGSIGFYYFQKRSNTTKRYIE